MNKVETIYNELKANILSDQYPSGKLPTERVLSEDYSVTRNTIKNVINALVEDGLVFKKQRSGIYINLLFKQNYQKHAHNLNEPLGVTGTYDGESEVISKVLDFQVIRPTKKISESLVISESEFVYYIKRVRLVDDSPISIEEAYIPIKHLPELSIENVNSSIFSYAHENSFTLSSSYISVYADVSSREDQKYLGLSEVEPVSVIEEIIMTDTGIPFEFTIIRNHYKKFILNTITRDKTKLM